MLKKLIGRRFHSTKRPMLEDCSLRGDDVNIILDPIVVRSAHCKDFVAQAGQFRSYSEFYNLQEASASDQAGLICIHDMSQRIWMNCSAAVILVIIAYIIKLSTFVS